MRVDPHPEAWMMLGPAKPRRLGAPVAGSREDLGPANLFSRHLEAMLGLGFVRAWVRKRCAERGQPSIAPVVFFKPRLVMFFEWSR